MSKFSKLALPVALSLLAAACGGGGNGGSSSGSDNQANLGGGTGNVERPTPGQPSTNCSLQYSLTDFPAAGSGTDPRIGQQWHLQPSGTDATSVWSTNKGDGVRVAVVDDAVETVHEDLRANVVAGASYNYRDASTNPLPCAKDDDHGTAVAGIIAAVEGNAKGVAGIAPRAALVGYNALATGTDADIADAMRRGRDDNQIVHNSWGSPDDGALHPAGPAWETAVLDGIRTGRRGLGTIYMFASGNGGEVEVLRTDGRVNITTESSNFDGFVNKLGVNAVCAVGQDGKSPRYAEDGANLLVCGPSSGVSGVTTTTIQNGYRGDFGGTSAATPMASGVAALVLKVNRDLTWRDVRLILARSARQNDEKDVGWLDSELPGTTPSVKKMFHHKYGYGTVDAKAAVALAANWPSVGNSSTLQSCGPYQRMPNRSIPDAGGSVASPVPGQTVADTVTVPADCAITKIEFVEVKFTSDHPYAADLNIQLVSPAERTSVLANRRYCGPNAVESANPCLSVYKDWRFGSVRHLDETARGNWRLAVNDATPGDVGMLSSWSVQFWGR